MGGMFGTACMFGIAWTATFGATGNWLHRSLVGGSTECCIPEEVLG